MSIASTFRDTLHRAGRPVSLKRRVGTTSTYVEATVYGKDTAFTPDQIVGGVQSGDRRIRISQADLAAANWPGPVPSGVQASQWTAKVKAGDILDGGTLQGAQSLYVGAELVGFVCWVRGGV